MPAPFYGFLCRNFKKNHSNLDSFSTSKLSVWLQAGLELSLPRLWFTIMGNSSTLTFQANLLIRLSRRIVQRKNTEEEGAEPTQAALGCLINYLLITLELIVADAKLCLQLFIVSWCWIGSTSKLEQLTWEWPIIKEPKRTHPQLEPNALLLSLHRATFTANHAHRMCTRAGYLASTGKDLNRGERGAASRCMPHPYRWKGAGWQRDGGPSQLFGLPGDGHLSLALHGCLCHYLHSARFLFVCWGTFFPPSKSVQHERKEKSIKDRNTWVTFLIFSSQRGDT